MKKGKWFTLLATVCAAVLVFGACGSKDTNGNYENGLGMMNGIVADSEDNYQYDAVKENGFVSQSEEATCTFSLDKNTASYTLMRNQINSGLTIATDSVRMEEYINYFNYSSYESPSDGEVLKLNYKMTDCPWNSENKLLSVGLKAKDIEFSSVKNNLVFLIDVSGSMYGSDRLGLVQEAFMLLTDNLNDADYISIVTYAGSTGTALDGARGNEKLKIKACISDLTAGGSTAGASGIQLAYQVAASHYIDGGNNRVILATDGDFNVGISTTSGLTDFISTKRQTGIYFSCLGVGMYNTNDSTMKALAENGNGNYAYIDDITTAKKVLVKEMNGTLVTLAKDAKAKVEFTDQVSKYRLLGYDTKLITIEEFENNETDTGEIGAGHTVTALFEVTLKENADGKLATATVRYKDVDENSTDRELTLDIDKSALDAIADEDIKFISCVAEYSLLLRNSAYKANSSFSNVITRLNSLDCVKDDEEKADFLKIVEKAVNLYNSQNYNK